jgi:peptidoglycan/xylan/chitin deacetylase (PgdA/CDA1 family)
VRFGALALGVLGVGAVLAVLLHAGRSPEAAQPPSPPRRPVPHPRPHPPRPHVRAPRPLALPATVRTRDLAVPILMYHRIDTLRPDLPAITRHLTVDPAAFAAQMSWLGEHGFHAVSNAQLFAALEYGAPLPTRPVAITFDDGYRDVLWHAAPVLHRLGMPATAYVITHRISGGDPSFLTWPELRRLEQLGVAVGSHTATHRPLTGETDTDALAELRTSRAALEAHLRHPVQWLAYPMGAEDARVVALTRRAGYVLAVTTRSGDVQRSTEPLRLERFEVLDTTGVAGLAALLAGA